jgi:hypothetical protein
MDLTFENNRVRKIPSLAIAVRMRAGKVITKEPDRESPQRLPYCLYRLLFRHADVTRLGSNHRGGKYRKDGRHLGCSFCENRRAPPDAAT